MVHLVTLFFTILFLSTGCYIRTSQRTDAIAEGVGPSIDRGDETIDASDALNDVSLSEDNACGLINLTRPCFCGDSKGRQVCTWDGWSACECNLVSDQDAGIDADEDNKMDGGKDAVVLDSSPPDSIFHWGTDEDTPAVPENCKAGRYSGFFEGYYISYIAPGLSQYIAATPTEDSPGLEFELVQTFDGEFMEIKGGKLIGMTETNAPIPFEADIEGTLDCATGELNAELLNGYYEYMTWIGRFQGEMSGEYNFESQSFESGSWKVQEFDPDSGLLHEENGGEGTWNATYVGKQPVSRDE